MKDRAPRVANVDGGWTLAMGGQSVLPQAFLDVLTQYDPVSGSHTGDVDARLAALDSEGVTRELAFPTRSWRCSAGRTRRSGSCASGSTTSTSPELQEKSGNRIFGVGLINWWDAEGAARQSRRAQVPRAEDVPDAAVGQARTKRRSRSTSAGMAMDDVWAAIEESQVPVAHHIGESPPASPSEFNGLEIGMLQAVAPFRDVFGKYILGGILDRHPGLQVGWFEGGINWVPSAIQDAQHIAASFQHMSDSKGRARPAVVLGTTT